MWFSRNGLLIGLVRPFQPVVRHGLRPCQPVVRPCQPVVPIGLTNIFLRLLVYSFKLIYHVIYGM